jgi:hypothetical protein
MSTFAPYRYRPDRLALYEPTGQPVADPCLALGGRLLHLASVLDHLTKGGSASAPLERFPDYTPPAGVTYTWGAARPWRAEIDGKPVETRYLGELLQLQREAAAAQEGTPVGIGPADFYRAVLRYDLETGALEVDPEGAQKVMGITRPLRLASGSREQQAWLDVPELLCGPDGCWKTMLSVPRLLVYMVTGQWPESARFCNDDPTDWRYDNIRVTRKRMRRLPDRERGLWYDPEDVAVFTSTGMSRKQAFTALASCRERGVDPKTASMEAK